MCGVACSTPLVHFTPFIITTSSLNVALVGDRAGQQRGGQDEEGQGGVGNGGQIEGAWQAGQEGRRVASGRHPLNGVVKLQSPPVNSTTRPTSTVGIGSSK